MITSVVDPPSGLLNSFMIAKPCALPTSPSRRARVSSARRPGLMVVRMMSRTRTAWSKAFWQTRGRPRFPGLQHVGHALHVGAEVQEAHAPVDDEHVAPLDDAAVRDVLDSGGAGDVDRGHVEGRAQAAAEKLVLHPPGHVLEAGYGRSDDLVRERTLRDLLRQLARLGEGGDLRGHAAVAEGGHESLGGDEPRRPGLAQGLGELDVGRVRETVGRAHLLGHVHADPAGRPFGHERPEVVVALHEVVGPAGLEHVALHPQGRALDPFAPAVGEHVEGRRGRDSRGPGPRTAGRSGLP